jgi:hypothetical protein
MYLRNDIFLRLMQYCVFRVWIFFVVTEFHVGSNRLFTSKIFALLNSPGNRLLWLLGGASLSDNIIPSNPIR